MKVAIALVVALCGALGVLKWGLGSDAKRRLLDTLQTRNRDVRIHQLVRYVPVVRRLSHAGGRRILEVGSGPSGLTMLMSDRRIVGCDLAFYRKPDPGVVPVIGSASALPFRDGTFDEVVSVEMMVEIPPADRPRVLREMLRVARRRLVVVTAWGEGGDRLHRDLHAWHLERRLPPSEWLVRYQSLESPNESLLELFEEGRNVRIQVLPGAGRWLYWLLLRLELAFVSGVILQLIVPMCRWVMKRGVGSLRLGPSFEKVLVLEKTPAAGPDVQRGASDSPRSAEGTEVAGSGDRSR